MRFKVKNTEINLSFTFFAVFIILLCIGELKICLYSLVASLIHEIVHIIFIGIFSGNITRISLSGFGANIVRGNDNLLSYYEEAVISFSAPVFNIIISLILFMLYKNLTIFAGVNLIIGLFNLLPYYDFDGGRGLMFLLKYFLSNDKAEKVLDVFSVTVTIIFSFVSVYIFFYHQRNITFIFLSIYMIGNFFVRLKPKVNKSYNY